MVGAHPSSEQPPLWSQKRREREMQQEMLLRDEETMELRETYTSLQQEVEIKTKKLKKVRESGWLHLGGEGHGFAFGSCLKVGGMCPAHYPWGPDALEDAPGMVLGTPVPLCPADTHVIVPWGHLCHQGHLCHHALRTPVPPYQGTAMPPHCGDACAIRNTHTTMFWRHRSPGDTCATIPWEHLCPQGHLCHWEQPYHHVLRTAMPPGPPMPPLPGDTHATGADAFSLGTAVCQAAGCEGGDPGPARRVHPCAAGPGGGTERADTGAEAQVGDISVPSGGQ